MSRYKYQGTFKDGNGKVVGTATTSDGVAGTISVYLAGGTTVASVYTAASGGTAVNSVSTDTHGHFYFWVDPKDYQIIQEFKITLSHSDFESKTYDNIVIFPGEGTIDVHPEWWGFSTSETAANNDTAFTSAVASMSAGQCLVISPGTFPIENIVFNPPDGCSLRADGILQSEAAGVAFTIGDSAGATSVKRYDIQNLKVNSTTKDHTGGRIGILLRNVYTSYIGIREVFGFETGIKLYGDGTGCVYNEIHLGLVHDNKYSLYLNAANNGWTNENSFYGGRFTWESGQDTAGYIHIWIDYYATHELNSNVFNHPSLEAAASTGADTALGIYCEGQYNYFLYPRLEMTDIAQEVEFTSDSHSNLIFYGYGLIGVADNVTDAGDWNGIFTRADVVLRGDVAASDNGILRLYNSSTEGTAPVLSIHGTDDVVNAKLFGSGLIEATESETGDGTNYTAIATNGDVSFAGTAGFYPRFLTQANEPAAGTGATQCDTSETVIWKDSDDNKVYLCFNDGGTVKTVELS